MSNNLYIPLHPGDYLADAAHLTTLEHGAYFLLILNYWQRAEPLAADDRKLARICRLTDAEWADVKPSLSEFFIEEDGVWKHKRIEQELAKALEKSAKAKASAESRYTKVKQEPSDRIANAERTQIDRNANQDQDQDQIKSPIGDNKPRAREALAEVLSPDMAQAVVDHRKSLRKPLTEKAASLLARKFAACENPNAGAEAMIANGWQGFEPEWLESRDVKSRAPPGSHNGIASKSNFRTNKNDAWIAALNGQPNQSDFIDCDYAVTVANE